VPNDSSSGSSAQHSRTPAVRKSSSTRNATEELRDSREIDSTITRSNPRGRRAAAASNSWRPPSRGMGMSKPARPPCYRPCGLHRRSHRRVPARLAGGTGGGRPSPGDRTPPLSGVGIPLAREGVGTTRNPKMHPKSAGQEGGARRTRTSDRRIMSDPVRVADQAEWAKSSPDQRFRVSNTLRRFARFCSPSRDRRGTHLVVSTRHSVRLSCERYGQLPGPPTALFEHDVDVDVGRLLDQAVDE